MESNSGLSSGATSEGVQRAICEGQNYGRKEYSSAERDAACKRYEQLVNEKNNIDQPNTALIASTLGVALIIVVIVGYLVYRRRLAKKKRR